MLRMNGIERCMVLHNAYACVCVVDLDAGKESSDVMSCSRRGLCETESGEMLQEGRSVI